MKGVRSGVERRRGRGLKPRDPGRRETPGKVLQDRRSPRRRGRMGTSVRRTRLHRPSRASNDRLLASPQRGRRRDVHVSVLPPEHPSSAVDAVAVPVAVPRDPRVSAARGPVEQRLPRGDAAGDSRPARRHRASVRAHRGVRPTGAAAAAAENFDVVHYAVAVHVRVQPRRRERHLRVVPYKAMSGWSSKASGGVERRHGRGLKARCGRREAPAKVLKDRRSPRQRGRMGTSV